MIEWQRNQMKELQLGNIDLLTYQKSIGGSIIHQDFATEDDIDFMDPLLVSKENEPADEEIRIPELWEIVAPLPVTSLPNLPVTSVPDLPGTQ